MTPSELAKEAREAWSRRPRRTPEEEFQRLIDSGLIELDANGHVKVLASKLFGEDEEEAEAPPKKKRKRKKEGPEPKP